jgi:putative ABC transport system permease protein
VQQIGWLFVIALSTGLISGSYPALYLSSLDPLLSLKGRFAASLSTFDLRKSLVIVQFSISIILLISTLVVYRQLNYMENQELGFKKDHLLIVDFQFDNRIREQSESVKSQLMEIPGIQKVSFTSYLPGRPNKKFPLRIENAGGTIQEFQSDSYFVDDDFISQFQIGTLEGRAFDKNMAADLGKSMIVNEAMVRSLGYRDPSKLIGKSFSQLEIDRANEGTIIGVVKDFHFQSFHEPIKPLAIRIVPTFFTYIALTLSSKDLHETIKLIEKKWTSIAGTLPFSYFFADEAYDEQYKSDQRFGRLFLYFSGLAILISCLGLLGLSVYSFTIRRKEIGIRKVIGASVLQIIKLLTWDFVKLVLIAFLIAAPIGWLLMNRWLENFAYHIPTSTWVFLVAGVAATLVTFITVGVYALKVAIINPISSLRLE